jgi:PhnB protein
MLAVQPYISFPGTCNQAIVFYQSALGAELAFRQTFDESPMPEMGPAGQVMHATLRIDGSTVMMCDNPRPDGTPTGSNISLAIGLSDTNRAAQVFQNLSERGTVIMPLGQTYWARAFGIVKDRFGVQWMVNCE